MSDYFSPEGRLNHIEKVKKGLENRKSYGRRLGPPIRLTDQVLSAVKKLKNDGKSNSQVIDKLKLKPSTYYRALKLINNESEINVSV